MSTTASKRQIKTVGMKVKEADKELYKIDKKIDKLVRKIELLRYINPINLEEQKRLFFESKFQRDPEFKYPEADFDKFKIHRKFFGQRLEEISDERIRSLYEDIVYYYSGVVRCIETIGEGKNFYYNSLHVFGTPTEQDVENAKFILHFEEEDSHSEKFIPKYDTAAARDVFATFGKNYDFDFNIEDSETMSAIAMVLNSKQSLVLNSNHKYSENELAILTNHEIGVHMVTTMNGVSHDLKIFSHGFPNNVETQEGLAVFSEYMSGNLTVRRLKELAYRVIAVDSLAKGYTFSRTFRLLTNVYDLDKERAFYITARVHRGGGFTKDYLYLTGLVKIVDMYRKKDDFSPLLSGKVTLEYLDHIQYLMELGYAKPSIHITDSFAANKNTNPTIDFILNNLK
ncbi:conserved hypothetical protein [Tenacibaculum litopenaei]